nr:MAG TPA: hypothetical protein [Crassvirales sp.]
MSNHNQVIVSLVVWLIYIINNSGYYLFLV